jgi:hypothetical protein
MKTNLKSASKHLLSKCSKGLFSTIQALSFAFPLCNTDLHDEESDHPSANRLKAPRFAFLNIEYEYHIR